MPSRIDIRDLTADDQLARISRQLVLPDDLVHDCWLWQGSLVHRTLPALGNQVSVRYCFALLLEVPITRRIMRCRGTCSLDAGNQPNVRCVNPYHFSMGGASIAELADPDLLTLIVDALVNQRLPATTVHANVTIPTCRNGHRYSPGSYLLSKDGHRVCRICKSAKNRSYYKKRRGSTPDWRSAAQSYLDGI